MDRFENMLDNYVYFIQKRMNEYYSDNGFVHEPPPVIKAMPGKRFVKIVKTNAVTGKAGSVHTFVEKETGNVYKAASWRAPAKHVRANIYDYESLVKGVNHHGAMYLR